VSGQVNSERNVPREARSAKWGTMKKEATNTRLSATHTAGTAPLVSGLTKTPPSSTLSRTLLTNVATNSPA